MTNAKSLEVSSRLHREPHASQIHNPGGCKGTTTNAKSADSALSRILDELPKDLRKAEENVPTLLSHYQQSRLQLGALLFDVQKHLAPLRRFNRYLKLRNIPKRTAYDLIAACQTPEKPARRASTVYTKGQHDDERYRILSGRVKAHFLPLKKEPDLRKTLEAFFREIMQELLPNATVEVREQ
jgi:hypothetical protein